MESRNQSRGAYEVPTYEAPADAGWFHFLHGNVPGHQIDFIYRHTIPWGPLSRQHFGHLVRILKYIEPRDPREQAFAIGNLSRDDTQHEPGHGGIALVLSLRVHGARDHAGREDPSFSHAIVGVDRAFDEGAFVRAALSFREQLVESTRVTDEGVGFYHAYASCGEDPVRAGALLRSYVGDFDDLPAPGPSRLALQWTARGIEQPKRIVIMHDDGLPFEALVRCAGRIAAILYTSDVRWTMISNGREEDLPNGTTIRFMPTNALASAEDGVVVHRWADIPSDAEELAMLLFRAKPVHPLGGPKQRTPWRDEVTAGDDIEVTIDEAPARDEAKKAPKRRAWRWFGMVLAVVLAFGGICAAWFGREQGAERDEVAVYAPVVEAETPAPTEEPRQAPVPADSGKVVVKEPEKPMPVPPLHEALRSNAELERGLGGEAPADGEQVKASTGKAPARVQVRRKAAARTKEKRCTSHLDDCTTAQRQQGVD
ncbi:MAG: hypothetical protein IPM54_26050 [Polyangiaceae bacterium]|nr:hypothetical protein [Polyangiaceae bacterium]